MVGVGAVGSYCRCIAAELIMNMSAGLLKNLDGAAKLHGTYMGARTFGHRSFIAAKSVMNSMGADPGG